METFFCEIMYGLISQIQYRFYSMLCEYVLVFNVWRWVVAVLPLKLGVKITGLPKIVGITSTKTFRFFILGSFHFLMILSH